VTPAPDGAEPAVSAETRGGVRLLSLNRSARRNAVNWDIWRDLDRELDAVVADDTTRCVILTGRGGFFSAGGDRNSTPAGGTRALALGARIEVGLDMIRRIRQLPVITVAAVEGGAIGIGWALALSCDLVVVAEDAFFSAPFNTLGLVPDGGLAWQLVHRVGRQRAMRLLLSGERLTARDAHALGLVAQLVGSGKAVGEALRFAESIAGLDPTSVELTKRLVAEAEQSGLTQYTTYELAVATLMQHHRASPKT
jgi:enoyl-CoA hydratase/carnithine racemase